MKKLHLRLLRMIQHHKGQFFAVTAVVVIGIMMYTAMSLAVVNLETTVNTYYDLTNKADIYVELVRIPENALDKIQGYDFVDQVEGRVVYDVPLKVKDDDEKVTVRIISQDKTERTNINSLYMIDGKYIEDKNSDVLVIEHFSIGRNIQVGDVIEPQILGKKYTLDVKGIVASPEYIYLMENEQTLLPDAEKFGVIFVSNELAQSSLGFDKSYNEILIKVREGTNVDSAINELEKRLKKYGIKRIYPKKDQLSNRMITEEIEGNRKSSGVVPVVFLGVAAIIISVMIHRMVKNDRITIGVFKALGYNNRQIVIHYTMFSILIGLLGATVGVLTGFLLSTYIADMYRDFFNLPMLVGRFYSQFAFTAVFMTTIYCVIAGVWGARDVMHIMPAEAMRPEAPKIGKRILLERIQFIWRRVSFSWKIVIRNLFRSKKRFAMIVCGIALTYAIMMIPIFMISAFSDMFDVHYGQFQTMDYQISFYSPQNEDVVNDFQELEELEHIEAYVEYPFEIVNGWRDKVVNVIGVDRETEFFNFENSKGQTIKLPEDGIVVTETLAFYLGLEKGDVLTLKSFIPDRDDKDFVIVDVIKQKLGLNAYMDLDYMQKELLDKELVTGVYIDAATNIKSTFQDVDQIMSIRSLEEMKDVFKEFLTMTYASIGIQLIFVGILGFAIVYNTTIMSINERKLEFSSLRVMGFSKRAIFQLILKENAIMTVFGLILGMPLGTWMVKSIATVFQTELYSFEAEVTAEYFVITGLASIVFIVLALFATYGKIHRLDFIDALKNRIS